MERTGLRLADVGGMTEVKARLEASLLAPLRNPELGRLYRKSTRGGLLLYGPPGCGKTYIARAIAGEMDARFIPVSLADVLGMFIGGSERNLQGLFEYARANAPCVIFLDEVDALGQKRTQQRSSATRGAVNQLLTEMDGVASDNAGVFVLGATNHPWDVDVALRRPGRFDRMVLVLPPDEAARRAVLRHHLDGRPIQGVDVADLAARTDGYSGADLAYVCDVAAERALLDSVRTGTTRMIGMPDLLAAVADVRPSTAPGSRPRATSPSTRTRTAPTTSWPRSSASGVRGEPARGGRLAGPARDAVRPGPLHRGGARGHPVPGGPPARRPWAVPAVAGPSRDRRTGRGAAGGRGRRRPQPRWRSGRTGWPAARCSGWGGCRRRCLRPRPPSTRTRSERCRAFSSPRRPGRRA